jgi:hypothetical protein
MLRINSWPRILHGYYGIAGRTLVGANRQFSRALLNRAHCFHGVQDQIEHDLLQLNAIAANGVQPLNEAGVD